jgi:exonuclease SbcC
MKLKTLKLSNFLSVKEAEIEFSDNGLVLVEGWNHDDSTSNGAGKSTIFNGLSYCIFGKTSRDISATEIVHYGSSSFGVSATFSSLSDTVNCSRGRNGSGKYSNFTKNELEITEAEFLDLIGITEDQFYLVQYISQGNSSRFLDLNDSAKKDLILKLINAEKFSSIKEQVDKDLKLTNKLKESIESDIKQTESKISAYSEMLEDTSSIEKDIETKELSRSETLSKIKQLEKKEKPDTSKYDAVIASLNSQLEVIREVEWNASSLRKQFKQLDESKVPVDSHDYDCPTCASQLDLVKGSLKVHDSHSHAAKVKNHNEVMGLAKDKLLKEINEADAKTAKKPEIELAISNLNDKVKEIMFDYKSADSRIKDLKLFLKQIDFSLSEIKDKANKNNKLLNNIETLKTSVTDKQSTLLDAISKSSKLSALSQVLSPTGVQAYVLDSVLDHLNVKIKDNLNIMWANANLELASFKENKSGNVTAKMSEILNINGVKRSIGSLSGGERQTLSLAIDMALVETVSNYMGLEINPLILDEPFDGMDAVNRGKAIALLQDMSLKRLIFVVDHSAEAKSLFDKSLQVSKRGGVSSITW